MKELLKKNYPEIDADTYRVWKGLKHWSRVTQEVCHSYNGNNQQFP